MPATTRIVVVGAGFPEHVIVPVREMQRPGGARQFIMGSVTDVDWQTRPLVCRTPAGDIELGFDHLVLETRAVTGWPAWLVWRACYLSQMPSFGRKLRIFVEWAWGMFFPPDITHLRFARRHGLKADEMRRQREHAATSEATSKAA